MDTSDRERPAPRASKMDPGAGQTLARANYVPEFRTHASRSRLSIITRIVAYGAWLLIFLLAALLFKKMGGTHSASSRPAPSLARAAQVPAPPPEKAPPAAAPAPERPAEDATDLAAAPLPQIILPTPTPEEEQPAQAATETMPRTAELMLSSSSNGNFYTEGEINGQKVMFVVDTGASAVSIPDKARWQLNLTRGRYWQNSTANGVTGAYETQVRHLAIGPPGPTQLHLKNVTALLLPNLSDDIVLLGMTALKDVRLLQQEGRMILQQELPPEIPVEQPAAPAAAPSTKLKKSVKDCMGTDKVINDRVLKCMRGEDEVEAHEATPAEAPAE